MIVPIPVATRKDVYLLEWHVLIKEYIDELLEIVAVYEQSRRRVSTS
jgi:hypothetical protein